jgi:hypothetical protein
MSDALTTARARVQALDQAVAAGDYGRDHRLWGGAGLGVVTAKPEGAYDDSARYVVTPHATSLSWLVRALWVACGPLLDSMTKIEFFGRLGNAAHRYQLRAGDNSQERELLVAVVHEAYEIVSDLEHGRFCALPVAPHGVIHDDFCQSTRTTTRLTAQQSNNGSKHMAHNDFPDLTLPFFAYGIFSPGQIAFFQIKNYVRQIKGSTTPGFLRIRDGVPLLDSTTDGEVVKGYRIEFDGATAAVAYQTIQDMEPSTQYRWRNDGEMNVLIGRQPQRGSSLMATDADGNPDWSSWHDPAFNEALEVVSETLAEPCVIGDLHRFFRLQGAYMVLWSSIERYASLRYGLGRNDGVGERVKRLGDEVGFQISLRATDPTVTAKLRRVFRSDDPRTARTFDPDGEPAKAIDYLYQVRSNVTHRGKEGALDWDLLHTATAEVLRIFRDVLSAAEKEARWTVLG